MFFHTYQPLTTSFYIKKDPQFFVQRAREGVLTLKNFDEKFNLVYQCRRGKPFNETDPDVALKIVPKSRVAKASQESLNN